MLSKQADDPFSDYINANYIDVSTAINKEVNKSNSLLVVNMLNRLLFSSQGYNKPKAYIATQGQCKFTIHRHLFASMVLNLLDTLQFCRFIRTSYSTTLLIN